MCRITASIAAAVMPTVSGVALFGYFQALSVTSRTTAAKATHVNFTVMYKAYTAWLEGGPALSGRVSDVQNRYLTGTLQ